MAKTARMLTVKDIICSLCADFHKQGWASGTGGGVSIKNGQHFFVAPSGVAKEYLSPEMIFELDQHGSIVVGPNDRQISECWPIFKTIYAETKAGCVMHSHSINAVLATKLFREYFLISRQEMIKGITGKGYEDVLAIPIIENTPYESQLVDRIETCLEDNGNTYGILVQDHGMYVWGHDWLQAKKHIECLDYLLKVGIEMIRFGVDPVSIAKKRNS